MAGLVIARHRKGRRRRVAGVFGLFVVFAGIGVPIGVAGTSGGTPARSGPVALRLGSYTLTLPDRYHLSDAAAPACAAAAVPGPRRPDRPQAAAAPGVCVLMFLTPSFSPRQADPDVPRGAPGVTVAHARAWLVPRAQGGSALIVEGDTAGGQVRGPRDRCLRAVAGRAGLARIGRLESGLSPGAGPHRVRYGQNRARVVPALHAAAVASQARIAKARADQEATERELAAASMMARFEC